MTSREPAPELSPAEQETVERFGLDRPEVDR